MSGVFLIAGEPSGDMLGATLMQALAAARPDLTLSGIGGPAMQKEGLNSLFPMEDITAMGVNAVLRKLPLILRRIRQTANEVIEQRPQALVLIDSPDFTLRVAKKVRRAAPDIPILLYVSPTVWAWRPGRAKAMRPHVDHIMALLPFEPAAHLRLGGPPCTYVGHPLLEERAQLRPSANEAARRASDPPLLLALPGSRRSEIQHLAGLFGEALGETVKQIGPCEIIVPTVPAVEERVRAAVALWPVPARVVSDSADKRAAFRQARAALAASGTVSLELALAGVPGIIAYRGGAIEAFVARKLVKVPSIVLANLVLGEQVMPEILQDEATPKALAQALVAITREGQERNRQSEAFSRIDQAMSVGEDMPSQNAARIVLGHLRTV